MAWRRCTSSGVSSTSGGRDTAPRFPGLPMPGPRTPRRRLSKKSPTEAGGSTGSVSGGRGGVVGRGRGAAGAQAGDEEGLGSGGRETRGPLQEGLRVDLPLRLRPSEEREGFLDDPAHGQRGALLAGPRRIRQGGGSRRGQACLVGGGPSRVAHRR